MILYILQCIVNITLIIFLAVMFIGFIKSSPTTRKVTIIDDISEKALSSMARQLVGARSDRDLMEKQWLNKQLECAELTSEIDRMVEQGAKTSLVKHPIFGGYTGEVTPETAEKIKQELN